MNNVDKQYLGILEDILTNGVKKKTRSGDVLSVFGRTMRFNLKDGLPLLTTKKVFYRGCIHELLWFLKGDTNIKYLVDNNVHIWDDDAYRWYVESYKKADEKNYINKLTEGCFPTKFLEKDEFIETILEGKETPLPLRLYGYNKYGDLGDVYGKSFRCFGTKEIDQIRQIIETLKVNPDDRRMLCVNFDPDVVDDVALPPCHLMFQFYTKELDNGKRELSCAFTMRSNDFCCGNPFNILQYALLTHMIAEVCDMEVGELVYFGCDVHVYCNHIEQAKEQLSRKGFDKLPTLRFSRKITDIDDFKIEDFIIENYECEKSIKYPLNVG